MNNDIQVYNVLLDHLDAARRKTDALIEVMREDLTNLEKKENPTTNDVKAATLMGEKIINHVLASKYMNEAYGALAFYRAVLEGLADEEDDEYDPDEMPDVPMDEEEIEAFESESDPDELPQSYELDEDDVDFPDKSDGPTCECDLPDDDVVFVHDFTKREIIH